MAERTPPDVDERLAAFDSVMWNVENDPILRSVIVSVLLLDRAPEIPVVTERLERLTRAVPRMRQRVVGNPASLISPRWEVDPNFDLGYHMRWVRAPTRRPGVEPALIQAKAMAEQDFDRNRPLWEMTLVTGLSRGRAAVVVKLHHSITDGMGAVTLVSELFDLERDPTGPVTPEPPPAAESNPRGHLFRLLDGSRTAAAEAAGASAAVARTGVTLTRRAASDPWGTVTGAREFIASVGRLLSPASTPLSPLWTDRGLSVRLAVLECTLGELRAAAKASGGTVNDAFLAVVMGAAGRYHEEHGAPAANGLRVNMPINTRAADDSGTGNYWVPARVVLPADIADPRARIKLLAPLLRQARTEPALALSNAIYTVINTTPRPITTEIAGGLMKGTDLAATNIPGPPVPIYLAGAKLVRVLPFAPKGGAAANVALLTYNGVAQICANIDPAAIVDTDGFVAALQASLDEVIASGRAAAR
jgi:WS/DGAT/MGAT family acyltransferase